MAMLKNIPVVTLRFNHAYFADVPFEVEVTMDDSTAAMMRNQRLMFRTRPGQVFILQEQKVGTEGELRPSIPTPEPLRFRLRFKTRDNYFFHYTDLPFSEDKKGRSLYLTNQTDDESLIESGSLHPEAEVISADQFHHIVGQQFSFERESDEPTFVKVANQQGEEVLSVPAENKKVTIDLSGEEQGRYKLTAAEEDFEFVTDRHASHRYLGLIDLIYDSEQQDKLEYEVSFGARQVHWRYNVINKKKQKTSYQVKDESNDVSFESEETLPEKEGFRYRMISENPIPVERRYKRHFHLVNGDGNPVVDSLPYPTLQNLKVRSHDPPSYLVEAFVSL